MIVRLAHYGGGYGMTRTIYGIDGDAPTLWAGLSHDQIKVAVPAESRIIRACTLTSYEMDHMNRVYSPEGIAPTIHTCGGSNTEPKVLISGGRE